MRMRDENGKLKVAEIDGRRHVVCNADRYDVDGGKLGLFCGNLVDVTEYGDKIPEDLDCGESHVSTVDERD